MLELLLRNWRRKLGALLLATLSWYFVTLGDDSTAQNTLFVPVTVEGLSSNQTPIGVPSTVTVSVSGPRTRVGRLRPENFEAVLDLTGISGEFSQELAIIAPQGITVDEVSPAEASGTVETITSKVVPVEVALLGQPPGDVQLELSFTPQQVTAEGRESALSTVVAARATAQPQAGEQEALLFAVTEEGFLNEEVSLRPDRVTLTLEQTPVLHRKEVALEVAAPEAEPFTLEAFEVDSDSLLVAGEREALAELERVTGQVELPTDELSAGEYTLPVTPQLPEGVAALETVRVQFRLVAPPESEPVDGDEDDLPSSTLRGPDSTEDGQPRDPVR